MNFILRLILGINSFKAAVLAALERLQADKVDQGDIDDSIDAIEIGGRNYILNSVNQESFIGSMVFDFSEPLISGETYTYSFYYKLISGDLPPRFTTKVKGDSSTWFSGDLEDFRDDSRNSQTIIATGGETGIEIFTGFGSSASSNTEAIVSNLKLEKGNKSTDWTPNPDDKANDDNVLHKTGLETKKDGLNLISSTDENIKMEVNFASLGAFIRLGNQSGYLMTLRGYVGSHPQLEVIGGNSDQWNEAYNHNLQSVTANGNETEEGVVVNSKRSSLSRLRLKGNVGGNNVLEFIDDEQRTDYIGRTYGSINGFRIGNEISGGYLILSDLGELIYSGFISALGGNSDQWNEAFLKTPIAVSFTGDSNPTLTITRRDGTTLTASLLANQQLEFTDDVINSGSFNDNDDGVIRLITADGKIIDFSIDNRYLLLSDPRIAIWNTVTQKANANDARFHGHANKAILDAISQEKLHQWNDATIIDPANNTSAKPYSGKLINVGSVFDNNYQENSIVYLTADLTWKLATNSTISATKRLAIYVDGKLLSEGIVEIGTNSYVAGNPLYLSTNGGISESPTNVSGNYNRIIGYYLGNNIVEFSPDNTWVQNS